MRRQYDTDTGSYFLVGALIVVIATVILLLGGVVPPYRDQSINATISTPHAELSLPYRSLG